MAGSPKSRRGQGHFLPEAGGGSALGLSPGLVAASVLGVLGLERHPPLCFALGLHSVLFPLTRTFVVSFRTHPKSRTIHLNYTFKNSFSEYGPIHKYQEMGGWPWLLGHSSTHCRWHLKWDGPWARHSSSPPLFLPPSLEPRGKRRVKTGRFVPCSLG